MRIWSVVCALCETVGAFVLLEVVHKEKLIHVAEDGRVVLIALTPKGRQWAEEALASSLRWSEDVLGRIPEARRSEVLEALEALVGAVDEWCGGSSGETSGDEVGMTCAPGTRGA